MSYDRRMRTPEGEEELKKIRLEQQAIKNASADLNPEAGCTAVVCLITQTDIIVANVGDSRCFVGVNRQAEALSFDHKPDNPAE